MASVFGKNFNIEYSIADGGIREFEIDKEMLYDEEKGIAVEGWEKTLYDLVEQVGLNIDKGRGLMRFVSRLIDEGKVKAG